MPSADGRGALRGDALYRPAYEAREERSEAVAWLYRAIAECPGVREPYLAMAALAIGRKTGP
jgi:hypothetical protein